jgi:uncharacterized protein (DUF1330 family)
VPKGYLIASISITDPERYERYKSKAPGVIGKYGGQYLVRGGTVDTVEGDLGLDRVVVLEFESLEQARRFYHSPEYQEIAQDRIAASKSNIVILEGCADPAAAFRK